MLVSPQASKTHDLRNRSSVASELQVSEVPYYMKFWRHFNLAILAIFQKIAKLKCTKIKCR